jgi:hypothetical protein
MYHSRTPGRDRTCDLLLRRQLLYPTELREQTASGTKFIVIAQTCQEKRGRYGRDLSWHIAPLITTHSPIKKPSQLVVFFQLDNLHWDGDIKKQYPSTLFK